MKRRGNKRTNKTRQKTEAVLVYRAGLNSADVFLNMHYDTRESRSPSALEEGTLTEPTGNTVPHIQIVLDSRNATLKPKLGLLRFYDDIQCCSLTLRAFLILGVFLFLFFFPSKDYADDAGNILYDKKKRPCIFLTWLRTVRRNGG